MNTQVDRRKAILGATTLAAACVLSREAPSSAQAAELQPRPIPPSPGWVRVLPPGPDTRVKITEAYAKLVARDAYFWAWPMVNVYSRRLAFAQTPQIMLLGPVP